MIDLIRECYNDKEKEQFDFTRGKKGFLIYLGLLESRMQESFLTDSY